MQERCIAEPGSNILTIRTYSGLSGDMFLTGLLRLTGVEVERLTPLLSGISPHLSESISLIQKDVQHVNGWHSEINLPPEHEHRNLADIAALIKASSLCEKAKDYSLRAFTILAEAEAKVHNKEIGEIHFHEVGALDSILDICLTSELFSMLEPDSFVVSPLPLADGFIHCAHGILPTPAPAVIKMLEGISVRPFSGEGETVTPTAMALLRSFNATFGAWPAMIIKNQALVYGDTVFPDAPNGALFVLGEKIR